MSQIGENMCELRFGPAGIPLQCNGSTIDAILCCQSLGLDAMEMEFVRSVYVKEEQAPAIKKVVKETNIVLSSHASYFLNFSSPDDKKREASINRLFKCAERTAQCGGWITVFHPGYYQKQSPLQAMKNALDALATLEESLTQHSISIKLGAETVGKKSAFGGLDEVVEIAQTLECVVPVIDFAHVHARGDVRLRCEDDYRKLFDKIEKALPQYLSHFHAHFSEIEYTDKGERRHLVLGTNHEPPLEPLLRVIKENGYSGTIICETPLIDVDAQKMKKLWIKITST